MCLTAILAYFLFHANLCEDPIKTLESEIPQENWEMVHKKRCSGQASLHLGRMGQDHGLKICFVEVHPDVELTSPCVLGSVLAR